MDKAKPVSGTLYLVGTPIGNLGDLSPRAAEVIAGSDLVAAEDTRRSRKLLNHLGITRHLLSYHEHNRNVRDSQLIEKLGDGQNIALVSDAGMPCISDPGSQLVLHCIEEGIPIVVVPGPCAAVVGLSGSGILSDRFVFEGFLPSSGKMRKQRVLELASEERTSVLYEAPHRLKRTLSDLAGAGLSERRLTLARELTKIHEEFIRTTVGGAMDLYAEKEPRGEYVLILEGLEAFNKRISQSARTPGESTDPESNQDPEVLEQAKNLLIRLMDEGLSSKDAVKRCADITGLKKNVLYRMALREKRE